MHNSLFGTLDSDISDRLVLRLSRLVMMLPVIGVETRAVMRAKVVQVMQQVSSRLTNYEAIRRVIRTAVDDAGLLLADDDHTVITSGRKELEEGEEDSESAWFNLPGALKPSSHQGDQKSNDMFSGVDESQIPVVAEVAVEAVLDYMSEILTPALVIHQLTEGIQSAFYQISKVKDLERPGNDDGFDDSNDINLDINALSSQNVPLSIGDHHGLNHLSDDWIWSPSPTTRDRVKAVDINEEDEEDDSRGQDEDLWDEDMETHDWGGTGHLFEDFEEIEGKDDETELRLGRSEEVESWDSVQSDDDDDSDEFRNPFAIGIQEENDDLQQEELNDESPESIEYYVRDGVNQFEKRSISENKPSANEDIEAFITSPPLSFSRRSGSASLIRRRPDFAPDPRLESLLSQLVEPVLSTFIEEDFPASCKRVQGELMDGIIWSLDQGESSAISDSEDQLILLSELEY
ncbi:hypothetical protein BGX26_001395 [Mortierella sp. AD094]|nr:hypothetical protein BGX26_001395 [Mortierella sp. AD094]